MSSEGFPGSNMSGRTRCGISYGLARGAETQDVSGMRD